MTGDDLDRALRALTRRHPFRPFHIEFISGDRVLVSHPESIDRQGEVFLYRGPDWGHRIFAAVGVCQLIAPPPAATPG
jgi:hypothetical protein